MSEIRTIFWDRFRRFNVLQSLGIDLAAFGKRHPSESFLWERGRISAEEYAARYRGLTAIRFDSPAQLRASLEELGITV